MNNRKKAAIILLVVLVIYTGAMIIFAYPGRNFLIILLRQRTEW